MKRMETDIERLKREVDCIYVEYDQLGAILKWKKKMYENTYYPNNFMFNIGVVVYKGLSKRLNGESLDVNHVFKVINENSFSNAVVTMNNLECAFFAERATDNRVTISFSDSVKKADWFVSTVQEEKANYLGQCIIALLAYVSEQDKERILVEHRRVATKKGNTLNVRKRKIITITNKIFEYTKNDEKREFNRLTESWGVRGHWRQYKTGKKVWVTPYVKGNGDKESKEYRLGDNIWHEGE